jgi:hypothetical protein
MTPCYEHVKLWFTPVRLARFLRRVDKREGGCWLWTGSLSQSGHGLYDFDGGIVRVHRLMWIMARERDLPEFLTHNDLGLPLPKPVELVIRHLMCDHAACCNPAHLVGGAQGENVRDIWLVHKLYDAAIEEEARASYRENPYTGHFSELSEG